MGVKLKCCFYNRVSHSYGNIRYLTARVYIGPGCSYSFDNAVQVSRVTVTVGQISVRHARVRAASVPLTLEGGRLTTSNSRVVAIAVTSPPLFR
jgi:hypothetical protein